MAQNKSKIIIFVLMALFVISFLLPTLQGPMGLKLNGISVLGIHAATFGLINDLWEYLAFLFTALTNVWVVVLLFWAFRKEVKLLPVIILSGLAISSAISWKINMHESGVLLIGYWMWVLSIVLISGFDILKAFKKI